MRRDSGGSQPKVGGHGKRYEEEGRRLLPRYVDAAHALSEAIGRGRLLTPGQPPMASVLNQHYLDERRRLEEDAKAAREGLDAWYRAQAGGE